MSYERGSKSHRVSPDESVYARGMAPLRWPSATTFATPVYVRTPSFSFLRTSSSSNASTRREDAAEATMMPPGFRLWAMTLAERCK